MFKEPQDFDLNLLRVLRALRQTRHVTKAAELLGMSQSGFSSALARLRRHAGEVLFVRTANGMVPTPRARAMMEAAVNILEVVQSGALEAPQFVPATARTEFRLAMSDLAEVVFLPRLLAHLQEVAPHTRVQCDALVEDRLQQALVEGEVDLAVGYYSDLSSQATRSTMADSRPTHSPNSVMSWSPHRHVPADCSRPRYSVAAFNVGSCSARRTI